MIKNSDNDNNDNNENDYNNDSGLLWIDMFANFHSA